MYQDVTRESNDQPNLFDHLYRLQFLIQWLDTAHLLGRTEQEQASITDYLTTTLLNLRLTYGKFIDTINVFKREIASIEKAKRAAKKARPIIKSNKIVEPPAEQQPSPGQLKLRDARQTTMLYK